MSAGIFYDRDGYGTEGPKLMGRQAAGAGFLKALTMFGTSTVLTGVAETPAEGRHFRQAIAQYDVDRTVSVIGARDGRALAAVGCLYMPQPLDARQAWFRELHGPDAWSLCGVTHSVSSAGIMDAVTGWYTAPFQPWDAVVCTSTAVRTAILGLLDRQARFLERVTGATRFPRPRLPIIPLGVDCDSSAIGADDRSAARQKIDVTPTQILVLYVGRLSFHSKANPAPMYIALERLAKTHDFVLVECGHEVNEQIAGAFSQARAALCPSIRRIGLNGRDPEQRRTAWAAADLFCSLSDNIQESFGMTPIEAMAAGLPCVVSDWNGYRETVRDGVDGFLIPTCSAGAGNAADLAHAHARGTDNYDMYLARNALTVAVDIDAVTQVFSRLAADPALRREMGASAARRARDVYDWRRVIESYEALWSDLAAHRKAASRSDEKMRGFWPARPDPSTLFAHYSKTSLRGDTRFRLDGSVERHDFEARLSLTMAKLDGYTPSIAFCRRIRDALETASLSVDELVRLFPEVRPQTVRRAVLLLLKFGLIGADP